MSHPEFVNRGNKLGKLIEECGECLAAAGKCVRFGMDSYNPLLPEDQREKNRDWLRRELGDLEEAIVLVKKWQGWDSASPSPQQGTGEKA